jgi:carbonic anhydrase
VIRCADRRGAADAALDSVFAILPTQSGAMRRLPESAFDTTELLPEAFETFHYDGSLTTPPRTTRQLPRAGCSALRVRGANRQAHRTLRERHSALQALEDRLVDRAALHAGRET